MERYDELVENQRHAILDSQGETDAADRVLGAQLAARAINQGKVAALHDRVEIKPVLVCIRPCKYACSEIRTVFAIEACLDETRAIPLSCGVRT